MTPEELQQVLTPDSSKHLAISATSIPDLADLFNDIFAGRTIQLNDAVMTPQSDTVFVVDATSEAQFGHDNPPFHGSFSVPASGGTVVATMRFEVIGKNGAESTWSFSDAFRELPVVFDFSKSLSDDQSPYLDLLSLQDANFYACTEESMAPDFKVPLQRGLNFAASWLPKEVADVLSIVSDIDSSVTLFGSINLQTSMDDKALALIPEGQIPPDTDPGIHLQVQLGKGKKLAGSNLEIGAPVYRVYSPLSFDKSQENPRLPSQMIEATMHIPSAGTDITISAEHLIGLSQICLAIRAQHKAGGIDSLGDAFGGSVLAALPDAIRDSVAKLTQLQLAELGLRISYGSGSPNIDLCFAELDFGESGLDWKIIPGFFTVNGLSARFMITKPFMSSERKASATVYGNIDLVKVPMSITTDVPDFFISAEIENQTIPLQAMMTDLNMPNPPGDLVVDDVIFNAKPHDYYSITARMATSTPWKISVGNGGILIEGVVAAFSRDVKSAQNSGSISGVIAFNPENDISVSYDINDGLRILGRFSSIDLVKLVERLVDQSLPLPDGFTLVLDDAILLIEKNDDDFSLMVGTKVEGFGIFAFEISDRGDEWGYAAGMALDTGNIDKIGGLAGLKNLADMFPLDTLLLIVGTFSSREFQFPDMDKFGDPELKGQIKIPRQAGGLQKGLSLYANTQLGKHESTLKLARLLHLSDSATFGVTLTIGIPPEANSSVYFSVGDIDVNAQTKIEQAKLGAGIVSDDPMFFLQATLITHIEKQEVEFDTGLRVAADGFYVYARMTAAQLLRASAIQFGPVQLAELLFVLGISPEGIPIIGIGATIDVNDFDSSVTLFFDGGNPVNCMFAGAVSPLSAKQVLGAFAGNHDAVPNNVADVLDNIRLAGIGEFGLNASATTALDNMDFAAVRTAFAAAKHPVSPDDQNLLLIVNKKGKLWHLTDMRESGPVHYQIGMNNGSLTAMLEPQAYCVLAPSVNVAGITFKQGIKVAGELDFLRLKAVVDIEAVMAKGIYFDVYIQPIIIWKKYFFSLTADKSADANATGPEFSLSTFYRDDVPKPKRDPHVFITGRFNFLGLSSGTSLSITANALHFHFGARVQNIVNVDLHADIAKNGDFDGGGSANVKLKFPIMIPWWGTVHFNAAVGAGLGASFLKGKAGAKVRLEFEFMKTSWDTGWVGISVDTNPFANFVDTFVEVIKEYFKHIFGSDLGVWLHFVHEGVVTDHEQISVVMKKILADDWKKGAQLLKDAGYTPDEAISYLSDGWTEIDKGEIQRYVHGLYGS